MRTKLLPAAAIAAAMLATPALAHRQWLLPSTSVLSTVGDYVTVDAAVSNDLFYPDHFPMRLEQVKAWAPDGAPATIQNGATGKYRTTFDVKLDKPGTWKIGTESVMAMGSFSLNGETWRVGGRRGPGGPAGRPGEAMRPASEGGERAAMKSVASVAEIPEGATDVKLTESFSRNYTFVTAGAPSTGVFTPTGKGLELQPVTHPDELVADEPGKFRFLIDGKPAAGVKVAVVPGGKKFRASEGAQDLTTGADGMLTVTWPTPGIYWISATAEDAKAATPRATARRMTYTMTVEVPAP